MCVLVHQNVTVHIHCAKVQVTNLVQRQVSSCFFKKQKNSTALFLFSKRRQKPSLYASTSPSVGDLSWVKVSL
jgi:hypothetical protein